MTWRAKQHLARLILLYERRHARLLAFSSEQKDKEKVAKVVHVEQAEEADWGVLAALEVYLDRQTPSEGRKEAGMAKRSKTFSFYFKCLRYMQYILISFIKMV